MRPIRRALLSVSDKRGLAAFARRLASAGVEILSTGGTGRHLEEAGLAVTAVSEVTGSPEILDGRVKTLHPKIHGALLADRSRPEHMEELVEHDIAPIDLVVVNLYPFEETVAQDGVTPEQAVDQIDIGGPTMVRAAAKNFAAVAVVVDPDDYQRIADALEECGEIPEDFRRRLAAKAFAHTRDYDRAIAAWLETRVQEVHGPDTETGVAHPFPTTLSLDLERQILPRYGENPHQRSAVYAHVNGPGIFGGMEQLQGKELSWNNLLDTDAARKMVSLTSHCPSVVIVKHGNPCGVGLGEDLVEAYHRALATDPTSAFGSIIATNRTVTGDLARAMSELFVEVVVAPAIDDEARKIYSAKQNLRLIECPLHPTDRTQPELRAIDGGFLAQDSDSLADDPTCWTCPTDREPTDAERRALAFAWGVSRYTKSNAIVVTNEVQTVGVGAGQMSRVDSCHLALRKAGQAGLSTEGTVAASDAFFPFRDGLDALADGGITAIVQPGGSKRDDEVVEAANERGIAMLFTGARHFRH
jgi:phosphoribosylaminoimidazolecarboxamide formyltransferase/IMP cyclohydrolase